MNRLLLAVIIPFFSTVALAKDFGTQGAVFPIREVDAVEAIVSELKRAQNSGELDAMNERFKQQALARVKRPKVVNQLTPATEYRTYLVDMTKTMKQDIRHDGQLIVKAGQRVNPLAHRRISKHLVIINGDNEAEVEYALSYAKAHPTSKIILSQGSPFELQKQHQQRFFFLQSSTLVEEFSLSVTPSVIYQDGLQMRVEEIPL